MTSPGDCAPEGDEWGSFEVSDSDLAEASAAATTPGRSLTVPRALLEGWAQQVTQIAVETRRGPRLVAQAAAGTEGSVQESLQWAQGLAERAQTLFVEMAQMDLMAASVNGHPGDGRE